MSTNHPLTMKSMFSLLDVPSWVEDFDNSTRDAAGRKIAYDNFLVLPEVEEQIRQILDRVHRGHGRGFLISGLYGCGKTLFMAYLSAVLTDAALLKDLLDTKPEWGLDAIVKRKYLTINFTAIANQDQSLEESLWNAVTKTFRSLTPSVNVTISDTENFLETFDLWGEGSRRDIEEWLRDREGIDLKKLKTYDPAYQKQQLENAMADLGMRLDEQKTTLSEKIEILLRQAKQCGYDGVAVFIDELYLHLIQSRETFNKDTAFLSLLAQAGMIDGRAFFVFAAMQEEIQAMARQAGQNYDTELMGRLAGQSGRFQYVNLPVTQFHRIYNHRLFRPNSKKIHKLADLFRSDLKPHFRGSFNEFFRRYFRNNQEVTDEAEHFADVYPVHPYAMHCLTKITNSGGRSRGALGFVDDFCHRATEQDKPWQSIARLDDVFEYQDLRNKIVNENDDIARFYGLFTQFCDKSRDEVLSRAPYRKYDADKKAFVQRAAERLIKSLIVLSMVREELTLGQLNDALMLRWPGHEHDPAQSDAETEKLLSKIAESFPPLRKKGKDADLTYYLSVEGDGGEREELQNEIERIINGQDDTLEREPAYRSQLSLYLSQNGPLGNTTPPAQAIKEAVEVEWQRTRRRAVYMLEAIRSLTHDNTVNTFLKEIPNTECLHLLLLYPAASPLDVEMDTVTAGDGRILVWLPATLQAQDVDAIRRSMALTRLHTDYMSKVNGGDSSVSDQRKLEIIGEMLELPTSRSDARPSADATRALRRAFCEGQIQRWNKADESWEVVFGPSDLLSLIGGMPAGDQSLATIVKSLADKVLPQEHPLHPAFDTLYAASADMTGVMQKRLLHAIWNGRATSEDATGKKDLEKYLGPLGLVDTSRDDEVIVQISTGSNEGFRKIRERIRDRIRKSTSDQQEITVPDLRSDLKAKDTALTDDWIDVLLTLLLSLGEITGVTADDTRISADNKAIGNPRDWLPQIIKLRSGSRPEEALWKDVVRSLQTLGQNDLNIAYTNHSAESLHERIRELIQNSEAERAAAEAILAYWSDASVPEAIIELADIFNISPDQRPNKTACLVSLRDALRDVVGLPSDDNCDVAGRYDVVKQWNVKLQASRDFLVKVREIQPIGAQLDKLDAIQLPASLAADHAELITAIRDYVVSGGTTGSQADIKALWQDLRNAFRSQYSSEHAGVNEDLRDVRDRVLGSDAYRALESFSHVHGLSAHYSTQRINVKLSSLLAEIQMSDVCDADSASLDADLEAGWACSVCQYKIGMSKPVHAESFIADVERGLEEYLSHVRGFAEDIQNYITDEPAAGPLADLLVDPLPDGALEVLDEQAMREHLSKALEDARAKRIEIDVMLSEIKPKLLGLYKQGGNQFREKFAEELEKYVTSQSPDDQPWKVE